MVRLKGDDTSEYGSTCSGDHMSIEIYDGIRNLELSNSDVEGDRNK